MVYKYYDISYTVYHRILTSFYWPIPGVNTGGVGSYIYHEPSTEAETEAQP